MVVGEGECVMRIVDVVSVVSILVLPLVRWVRVRGQIVVVVSMRRVVSVEEELPLNDEVGTGEDSGAVTDIVDAVVETPEIAIVDEIWLGLLEDTTAADEVTTGNGAVVVNIGIG